MPPHLPQEPDRRVAKTKLALRDAMLTLLAKQGWDDLSIQTLCDQANIGRSTFYVHYQSKDDLLTESFNDLRDFLTTSPDSPTCTPPRMWMGLLHHMAQQRAVFKAVIGRRSGHLVSTKFKEMVRQLAALELAQLEIPEPRRSWLSHYLAGGITETMAWWVDAPEPPPIQALEQQLAQLRHAALSADATA